MQHPFEAMAPDFRRRIAAAVLTRRRETNRRAAALVMPAVVDRFRPAHEKLGIPLVWMICSFERESGCNFSKSPAQGDPWNRPSVHVPRGVSFKSFEDAAVWSYRHDGIAGAKYPWSMTYACYAWNLFNGFGPNDHGRVSGYVFAGTDQYDPPAGLGGKYVADGKWDPDTVDQQLGCLALATCMIALAPELAIPADPDAAAASPAPHEAPLPAVLGGGQAHPTAWVQDALNRLRVPGTPLLVDGSFGRRTGNALRAFQASAGIVPDGLLSPETLGALETALADIPD